MQELAVNHFVHLRSRFPIVLTIILYRNKSIKLKSFYLHVPSAAFSVGLRVSVLVTIALMFVGTGLRCITSEPKNATW